LMRRGAKSKGSDPVCGQSKFWNPLFSDGFSPSLIHSVQ
jgi:hypothetical protein